jgi:hypothetical protein
LLNPSQAVDVTRATVRSVKEPVPPVSVPMAALLAFIVEPEAVAKPSQTVEVTLPIVAELAFKLFTVPDVAVNVLSVVLPTTVKVEVTVEEEPTKPPYKRSVEVAKLPRAVTLESVSVSAKRYAGQFVPFVRHTVAPPTVSVLKEPTLALIRVVDTTPEAKRFVAVALVAVTFWRLVPPRTVSVLVTVDEPPTKPPYS